jgi:hypothetical protein
MNALVVYESMFGNTEAVARAVAEGVGETMDVWLHEVSTAPAPVTDLVDLIVVGGPTHAFSLSRPSTRAEAVEKGAAPRGGGETGLREWIGHLREGPHSEYVAAFDTRVGRVRRLPGSAARKAVKLLRRDGYTPVGTESFYVSDISGPLLPGETERAAAWGRRLAEEMVARSHGRTVV